jgi:tRNA1(Val) A37 N6-methylase TrmN6
MSSKTPSNAEAGRPDPQHGSTLDRFLGGRIAAFQPKTGHRSGLDAVFLAAAAVQERDGARCVLDAGAGVGVAGLCLLARVPDLAVTAVERDAELCALARLNAERNGFSARYAVVEADVTAPSRRLAALGLQPESFDHVMANPPFFAEARARGSRSPGRAAARVMPDGALAGWVRFLAAMTAPKGRLTLIHRPEALKALLDLLAPRFGGLTVFPLFPRPDQAANLLLISGLKASRAPLRLLRGMVLHAADGGYAAEAEAVLRHGAGLDIEA